MDKEQRNIQVGNQNSSHLPIYGVGPYYGVGIIILTFAGIILSVIGALDSGKITNNRMTVIMVILGIILFVEGFLGELKT